MGRDIQRNVTGEQNQTDMIHRINMVSTLSREQQLLFVLLPVSRGVCVIYEHNKENETRSQARQHAADCVRQLT